MLSALSITPLILLISVIFIFYKFFISSEKEIIKRRFAENNSFTKKSIFGLIIVFALAFYGAIESIDYLRDLPYVMTENYPVVEGKITKEVYISGKNSHTLIVINNITYTFYGSGYPPTGTLVSIKYLPNIKEIYNISWR
jgi:hypothetical protein